MLEEHSFGGLVDPRNDSSQSGLSPELADNDDGTNYLRRLKGKSAESPTAAVNASACNGTLTANKTINDRPATGAVSVFTERRKAPRFSCTGRIEMRVEGADYRMWGTLTDLSLQGCYVEMNNTYPVGTKLNMELEAISMKVKLSGIVRAAYPFLGMGISFDAIEFKQLAQLQELLTALAGRKAAFGASAL
jgi:hypothetical protein